MERLLAPILGSIELPSVSLPKVQVYSIRITDSESRAIEGVRVFRGDAQIHPQQRWQPGARHALTDTEGLADIPLAMSEEEVFLVLDSSGFLEEWHHLEGPRTTIRLRQSQPRSFQLLNSEGFPVEGASIRSGTNSSCLAITDREGAFAIINAPKSSFPLNVTTSDGGSANLEVLLSPSGTSTIRLPPIPCVTGRIVDESGLEPIPDSWIWLRPQPEVHTKTQEEGLFEICYAELWATSQAFQIQAAGYAPTFRQTSASETPVSLDLGSISLQRSVPIRGQIIDDEGKPITDAKIFRLATSQVILQDHVGRPGWDPDTISDKIGNFSIDAFTAGEQANFLLWHIEFRPRIVTLIADPRAERTLVRLRSAIHLHGRVVSTSGAPLPGSMVVLGSNPSGRNDIPPILSTDATGTFHFKNLQPKWLQGTTVALSVRAPGHAWWEATGINLTEPVEIVLEPGASIIGRGFDPEGHPLAGATLKTVTPRPSDPFLASSLTSTTNSEGRFELIDLPPGLTTLEATHPQFRRLVLETSLVSGQQKLDIHFKEPLGYSVSGRILDEKDSPLGAITLNLVPIGGGQSLGTATSSDGRFLLEHVVEGRYKFRVRGSELVLDPSMQEITIIDGPHSGVDLRLQTAGKIQGLISGLSPQELSKTQIHATGSGRKVGYVNPSLGDFQINNLSPGIWNLEASVKGTGLQTFKAVRVSSDRSPTIVDLDFGQRFRIEGSVILDRQPLPTAWVVLKSRHGQELVRTATNSSGIFEFPDLHRSTYQLEVRGGQSAGEVRLLDARLLEVISDKQLVIDIHTSQVEGVLVDLETGDPVSGAVLQLWPSDLGNSSRPLTEISNNLGEFTFNHLPAVRWRLLVNADGYGTFAHRVETTNKPYQKLALELRPTARLEVLFQAPWGGAPSAIEVVFLDSTGLRLSTGQYTTGVGGKVRFSHLPSGLWYIAARTTGGLIAGVTAVTAVTLPHSEPLQISLVVAGGLEVLIPDLLEGGSIANLDLRDLAGHVYPWTNQVPLFSGREAFNFLTPGIWTISAKSVNGNRWKGNVQIIPSVTTSKILEMDP
jgi:protocatechuate 3,4-dioxygenase beta subunit